LRRFGFRLRFRALVALSCAALAGSGRAADAPAGERVEGDTLFFTGTNKATATAQLLRVPSAPPQLASANGVMKFAAGRDFTWQPGSRTVTLTAESRVPFKTTDELHPAPNAPNAYKSQRGADRWMFFGPGRVIHDLQCVAGYASADEWRVPFPAAAPDAQLGGLRAKLRAREPVKFVMLGDSISTEADASALADVWPHQPGYPRLVARALETRFGGKVTLKNLSKGGMDSKWGVTRVPDVIAERPDLLLIAFGMNDASGRRTAEEFARVTRRIIDPVRAARPDCAIVLVTSMTANSEWIHSAPELYPAYAKALAGLTGPGIALADVTSVWTAVESRKKHFDLTGNGLNHPNDFGHRLYADSIMAVLGGGQAE
jgi:lysophospholipase L1-like esterase